MRLAIFAVGLICSISTFASAAVADATSERRDRAQIANVVIVPAENSGSAYDRQREGMVAGLQAIARSAARSTGVAAFDTRVIEALTEVPRHDFVPATIKPLSYLNRPLPLGWGYTMPSPFLTALMAQVAEIEAHEHVLQTDLRAGYQTAVLARLAKRVDVGARHATLATHARAILLRLGIRNVGLSMRTAAGTAFAPQARYDAILVDEVSAAAPEHLLEKLNPEGRLVFPRLLDDGTQMLTVVARTTHGHLVSRDVLRLTHALPGTST
jgi:protein-L-isoaspartate(D-aspartate) O-methyltransferase